MNELAHALRAATSGSVLGLPVPRLLAFLAVTAVAFLLARLLIAAVKRRLSRRLAATPRETDEYLLRLLDRTWSLSLLAASALLALAVVDLRSGPGGNRFEHDVRTLASLMLFVQAGLWGMSLIDSALIRGFRFAKFSETASRTAFGVVRFFAMVALWMSVAILILGGLGVEVTPLLAGLGVGGIAIGFALQKILGDVFCSVAIVLDRPFEVGDFIAAGGEMGTVEQIGVKTTRLRSLSGEQIVFPNADLIQSRIHNHKRMTERRVAFNFSLSHATPTEVVERIPGLVREFVESNEKTRFDRAHFLSFGETSFNFEVVYYVLDPDFHVYADIQQRINLAILHQLDQLGVSLTIPSSKPKKA
jgi:small-conductance mechanosensitive channel